MQKKSVQSGFKFMKWALPNLPTGTDIANLVKAKVIEAKEARQILFHEEENS